MATVTEALNTSELAPALGTTGEALRPDQFQVLLIEDSPSDFGLITAYLRVCSRPRFRICHASSLRAGLAQLGQERFDAILLDMNLPDSRGLSTFERIHQHAKSTPVVILSGEADDSVALAAVRLGAQDALGKNDHLHLLLPKAIQYAVERNRRQHAEGEIRSARFVQQRLYPTTVPEIVGIDMAGRCDPAEFVGGDYYDYLPLDGNTLLLAVGDVSGHDVGSAMVMSETRAALRTLADGGSIQKIVRTIHRQLIDDNLDHFVSLHVAKLHVPTGHYQYCAAGQPAELLRASGTVETLNLGGPPLGVDFGQQYRVCESQLQPGDLLLLYTDGITERGDQSLRFFGLANMLHTVRASQELSANEIVDRLFATANAFAGDQPPHDDMTAVILKME